MEIYCLVKQVPDPEALIKVAGETKLEIENRYFTSFFDEVAIEAGLRLRDKWGGRVTVLTVDLQRLDALRRGVAMGADEAVQISDPALVGTGQFTIARVIGAYLQSRPFDVILCGRQSMDEDAGIVGAALAEHLGIPHVSAVVSLEAAGGEGPVTVARELDRGRELLSCSLPALFTCQKGLCEPRIPLVMNVMRAMKSEIKKFDLAALGLAAADLPEPAMRTKRYLSLPPRRPVLMIDDEFPENVRKLVKLLREEARVL